MIRSTLNTTLQNTLQAETEKLLGCVHCGLCLPACPTYMQVGNENDSPRGRIYLMRAVAEGRLDVQSELFARHIDLCLGCRACETACPAGVHYSSLLEAARGGILAHESSKRKRLQKRVLSLALRHLFPYPNRLRVIFAILRFIRHNAIVKFAMRKGIVRRVSPQIDFALALLLSTAPHSPQPTTAPLIEAKENSPGVVTVFTGCVMEGLFKQVNDATARVLMANGCQLRSVKEQVCCGALHAHAGDVEMARLLARRNIDAFIPSQHDAKEMLPIIIVNAAGCGAILKEYGELLKDDPKYARRARMFATYVRDISEYLVESEIRRGALIETSVTYDAPCHLYHAQRVNKAPQQLLAAIPGLEYRPLDGLQDCCGGAGIYNLTEPEMSEQLLADKMGKVKATGAKVLVTANPGCQMQLGAGARGFKADCRVAHIIELLDESYQRAGFYCSAEGNAIRKHE